MELLHFQVYNRDHANVLHWETASERNSHHFEIQYSTNGREFKAIGEVQAAGESSKSINYTFQHDQPIIGTHYYRLKSVDKDGSFAFSPIVSVVNGKEAGSFVAYPNPTQNRLSLQVVDRQQATRLYDAQGKLVYNSSVVPEEIDMTGWPEGFYVLQVGEVVMKVVKE